MNTNKPTVDPELEALQRDTFSYFLHETNPHNGLVRDKTASDWPASIAATGLALAGYPVVVERGFITRATYLYAGPLFTHQISHVWIDFRGIRDAFMRDKDIDYFENSRRATYQSQRHRATVLRLFRARRALRP
jgi:hypothetical protein